MGTKSPIVLSNEAPRLICLTPAYQLWEVITTEQAVELILNGRSVGQSTTGLLYSPSEKLVQLAQEFSWQILSGLLPVIPQEEYENYHACCSREKLLLLLNITLLRAYTVFLPVALLSTPIQDVLVEITGHAYTVYCESVPILNVTPGVCTVLLPYWEKLGDKIPEDTKRTVWQKSLLGIIEKIQEVLLG